MNHGSLKLMQEAMSTVVKVVLVLSILTASMAQARQDVNSALPGPAQLSSTLNIPNGSDGVWSIAFPAADEANILAHGLPPGAPSLQLQLWIGSVASGIKCLAKWKDIEVLAFSGPNPMLFFVSHPELWVMAQPVYIIQRDGIDFPIEEMEVNPGDGKIYAVGNRGNEKALYRLDLDVFGNPYANAVYVGKLFHNPSGNGYRSGSIAFVQDSPVGSPPSWHLAFTTESGVYASHGIVVWRFNMPANPLPYGVYLSSSTARPARAYTGITNPQTGKINTVSLHGKLYFARDNGVFYELDLATSTYSNPATPLGTIQGANDFAPVEAH